MFICETGSKNYLWYICHAGFVKNNHIEITFPNCTIYNGFRNSCGNKTSILNSCFFL